MNIPEQRYSYMRELVRGKNEIPTSVKEKLGKIIGSL
jgi:hypothetical protein